MCGYGLTAADKTHKSPHSSYGKTWWPEQLDGLEWAIEEARKDFGHTLPLFTMGIHGMYAQSIHEHITILSETYSAPFTGRWYRSRTDV